MHMAGAVCTTGLMYTIKKVTAEGDCKFTGGHYKVLHICM